MRWPKWTGVGEQEWDKPAGKEVQPAKTLWDWLQLLIVPAILILVVTLWNSSQSARDNRRSDQQRQDATLDSYYKQMSGLMLNNKLLTSADGSAVRAVATSVTNSTLRRLDGERQGEVVRFLSEAGTSLMSLNLNGQDLTGQDLDSAYLNHADFEGTNLQDATLVGATLRIANLTGADLKNANLYQADLLQANLQGADLKGAFLENATLVGANLEHANLTGAELKDADLTGALFGDTTCPNGKVTNTGC